MSDSENESPMTKNAITNEKNDEIAELEAVEVFMLNDDRDERLKAHFRQGEIIDEVNDEGMKRLGENKMLVENRIKRQNCWEKHKDWLLKAKDTKGKGIRTRKYMVGWLCHISNFEFNNGEEEYKEINKFGRGMWDKKFISAFTKEQQVIIREEIARDYGSFDY